MARLEPEAPARNFVAVDLAAQVRDAIVARAALAADKRIDMGLARCADVPVRGDATSLAMLLANLLDNALRYTPEGGRIDVAVDDDGGRAVLVGNRHRTGHPRRRSRTRVRTVPPRHQRVGRRRTGRKRARTVDRAAHRRRAWRYREPGRRPGRTRPFGPRALSWCERILIAGIERQVPRIHYARATGRHSLAGGPTAIRRSARHDPPNRGRTPRTLVGNAPRSRAVVAGSGALAAADRCAFRGADRRARRRNARRSPRSSRRRRPVPCRSIRAFRSRRFSGAATRPPR